MENTNTKHCKNCNESKPLAEFYRIGETNSYQTLCIICHNLKRKIHHDTNYVRVKKGLDKYDPEIIKGIRHDLDIGLSIKRISLKYDIKYPKLYSWIYQKKI